MNVAANRRESPTLLLLRILGVNASDQRFSTKEPQGSAWSIGVANRRNRRLADSLIRALRDSDAGPVGDNEPYGIEDPYDYSLPTHGERRGIAHAMIEIRQEGLRDRADARLWAERVFGLATTGDQHLTQT